MDYILLLFIIVFFIKSRFHFKDNNENYISRKQTQCINGFFVLIVFLRHFKSYIKFGDFDHIFQAIDGWTGQLIVVPFLFFSGYGIMLSISKKGTSYVNSVITKRFPKVWIHFMMAIVLFVFTNMYLGNKLDIYKVLFSLIGWDGIGNSNWYIFDTLVLYILTFFSFRFTGKNNKLGMYIMSLLSTGFVLFMVYFKQGYWYNTIIAYPLGMLFAFFEPKFRSWINKSHLNFIILATAGAVTIFFSSFDKGKLTSYEVFVTSSILIILALSLKVEFGNKILEFLGKYVFEIYILQRIPMLLLKQYIPQKYLYFAACFAATIVISILFRFAEKGVDYLIDGKFLKKNKKTE